MSPKQRLGVLIWVCLSSYTAQIVLAQPGDNTTSTYDASITEPLNQQEELFPTPAYLLSGKSINNIVVDWNQAVQWGLAQAGTTNLGPRICAFMHMAMLEALNVNNATEASGDPAAVVGYAAMTTLKSLLPGPFARYNELYRRQTLNLTTVDIKYAASIAGPVVASFLSTRLDDGFNDLFAQPPTEASYGQFVNISDKFTALPYTQYANTMPLALPDNITEIDFIAEFPEPPVLNSSAYNVQLKSVTVYGANDSTTRDESQTNTAIFWGDQAYTTSVVGLWNRVLISTLPSSISLEKSVDIFAKLNTGLYDCVIATTYLRNYFNRWRPLAAIRTGSPGVPAEPDWTPLLDTPNSPSYPSISGCYAGLTSNLFQSFYGTDSVLFTVATERTGQDGMILPSRIYQSFAQVAAEVIQSRYLGGIEFPIDSSAGQALGEEIAEFIWSN